MGAGGGGGGAPQGSPQPGSPGGGASPSSGTPTATAALALVPAGLQAVAIFPPYEIPRTVPAVSVIFREDSSAQNTHRYRHN